MSVRRKFAVATLGLVALAVAAFFAIPAFLGFEAEGPPRLVVGDRATEAITAVVERGAENPIGTSSVSDVEPSDVVAVSELDSIGGRWVIAGDSVAGYRVFKEFIGVSEFEAVGRTSSIFGSLTISETTVTEAEFNVDIASVTSDDERRDRQFRGPILNAALYPFATFELLSEIDLGEVPSSGEEVTVDAEGELTLRGETQPVSVALTARLVGDVVQVAGSIDVLFSEFEIVPPSTPSIVVADEGIIEFSLFFEKATTA